MFGFRTQTEQTLCISYTTRVHGGPKIYAKFDVRARESDLFRKYSSLRIDFKVRALLEHAVSHSGLKI